MYKLLKKYPLKTKDSKLTPIATRQLQKLIYEKNLSLSTIAMQMNRFDTVIIDEIVIMIRSGLPIRKKHLNHLVGVTDELLDHIKSNITDYDFANLDDIPSILSKFTQIPQITEKMLTLVMHYLKVRQFLESINVPFFDIDDNRLVNGRALLGSKSIDKDDSNVDQSNVSKVELPMEVDSSSSQAYLQNSQKEQFVENAKSSGSVTSSQNSQSSWNLQLSEEDSFLTQVMDDIENKTNSKPLQASQKTNQNNNIKQFEPIPPSKMYAQTETTTKTSNRVAGKKRTAVQKVQYLSDSDDDDDDKKPPQTKRVLPQWLTTKKPATTNASQSNVTRKKSFF